MSACVEKSRGGANRRYHGRTVLTHPISTGTKGIMMLRKYVTRGRLGDRVFLRVHSRRMKQLVKDLLQTAIGFYTNQYICVFYHFEENKIGQASAKDGMCHQGGISRTQSSCLALYRLSFNIEHIHVVLFLAFYRYVVRSTRASIKLRIGSFLP